MPRWINILLIATLAACGKPAPARHDPAPTDALKTAVSPTADKRKPATLREQGMDDAAQIAALIAPAKLATLKERGANPRIFKITAILITAKASGKNPETITNEAVVRIGWGDTDKGSLTADAIIKNIQIAEQLGSTTPEDIAKMKKGQSPLVWRGPYAGDILSVDHIIPVVAVPELSNTIANLELMPLRANQSKNDSIGPRQRELARKLHAAGLLKNPELPK